MTDGTPGGEAGLDEQGWLERVRRMERRHELLLAVDLARRGLNEHPDSVWLRHRAVLCLLRMGAIRSAGDLCAEIDAGPEPHEDIAVLPARIAKERMLEAPPSGRAMAARAAADLYEAVFRRPSGTTYAGINAATLRLFAGDAAAAERLADEVLSALDDEPPAPNPYYQIATRAEALLLKGDLGGAAAALAEAVAGAERDRASETATRRQLKAICEVRGHDPKPLLAPLEPPAVIHYTGHIIAPPGQPGRFPAPSEAVVGAAITGALETAQVGYGYGSLAAGADILFAEALLARGAEVHVTLPFARDDFVRTSVATAGATWVERFEACLARASSVTLVTDDPYLGDPGIYAFASLFAMGRAILQAQQMDTAVRQIAVFDGEGQAGEAGTGRDIVTWSGFRGATSSIHISPRPSGVPAPPTARPANGGEADRSSITADVPTGRRRHLRALLFGDVAGFSKLPETQILPFVDTVLSLVGDTLGRFDSNLCHRNTWGDGLYLVFDEPEAAADCALDLQERFAVVDFAARGLPPLGLRLGGHYGPVFEIQDPVTDVRGYMGRQVSRTARIEPITPPGELYVTDLFAASLALRAGDAFTCDYKGHVPAAKDWGMMPMYLVRRRSGPPTGTTP